MRLRLTPRAHHDRLAIFDYVGRHSPRGAVNVMRAIQDTIDLIAAHPECGRETDRKSTRGMPVSKYPYRVFYRLRRDQIDIVHIRHTSRAPWKGSAE